MSPKPSSKKARLSLTQSKVLNLQTRPEATFLPRVNGDPGRNFTPVAGAHCPMVGVNYCGILRTVALGMAYRRGSLENNDGSDSRLGSEDTTRTQVQGPPLPALVFILSTRWLTVLLELCCLEEEEEEEVFDLPTLRV
jgi:hypothetical protein